jgi:hypothetical protein
MTRNMAWTHGYVYLLGQWEGEFLGAHFMGCDGDVRCRNVYISVSAKAGFRGAGFVHGLAARQENDHRSKAGGNWWELVGAVVIKSLEH